MIGTQDKKRAALSSKLQQLWKSGPEVSYNMNVRSGIFRVAVSDSEVTGFLDDKPIKSIKIEDLDEEIREALEKNPEEAGALIVEELINAHKEGKLSMSTEKITKEARAGENNAEDQLSGVTERQLKDAGPLYDRQEEERKDVTEKQLGDKGYKEYEKTARVDEEQKSITEKQFAEKKNPNPDTSPREDEEKDSITQKQLEGGTVNARKDEEKKDITEKQMEKDFRNDEIRGVTEKQLAGKEQSHDKVLIQRLASKEEALTFAKKVAKSTAHTLKSKELDKDEVLNLLKASVRNFSAQKKLSAKLAQIMDEELPPEDLDMEVPEDVGADILSDEDVGGAYDADLVVNVLKSMVENPKFVDLVNEAMTEADETEEELPADEDLMDDALGGLEEDTEPTAELPPTTEESTTPEFTEENDGLVAVEGSLAELEKEAGNEDLEKAAFSYSRKVAGKELGENAEDFVFEVDKNNGTYRAIFIDPKVAKMDSTEVKELLAKRENTRIEKISSSLEKLEKQSQAMPAGGGIPNLAPGGEPAGGGGTTLPPGPAGGGLETPPVESFDTGAEGAEGAEDIGADNEPSPPGTRCPVCGSDDVDVEKGNWECNSCQSNGEISVSINVKEWAGTLEDNEGPNAEEEGALGEGEEIGETAPEAGAPMGAPTMPLAASTYRINGNLIKEAINSGKGYYRVGEHCPNCGSDNTDVDHVGNGKCYSCSQVYISKISHKNGEFKGLSIWQPIPVKPKCPDCKAKAMGKKIAQKYALKFTKKASKEEFPYEDCVNKIAKRYGLNAVALSGDCAGKSLIDCICKKMKSANRYSQTLMMALASRLTEKDPMEECIEDQMRDSNKKMTIKEACAECEKMKSQALAEMPEQDEIEQVACQDINVEGCLGKGTGPEGFGGGFGGGFGNDFGLSYDIDSFDGDTTTLSTEDKLLEQIQQLLEVMKEYVGGKTGGDDDSTVDIFLDEGEGEENGNGEEIIDNVDFIDEENNEGKENEGDVEEDQVEFVLDGGEDEDDNEKENGEEEAEGDAEEDQVEFTLDEGKDEENEDDENKKDDNKEDEGDDTEEKDDDTEEEDDEDEDIEEKESGKIPGVPDGTGPGRNSKNCPFNKKDEDDEGEKIANANKVSNNKKDQVMDLDKIAKEMSGKKIKRYADTDVLKTADTMQINDLLGDRKIGDSPSEKTVERVTSQDTKDVGKVQDGKTMGEEEKFNAKEPDIPQRGSGSTMGEGEEIPEGKAKVPAGQGAMGTEKDTIEVEVSVEADGRVASVQPKTKKTAGEKKVEDPKPVDQSKDLKNQKLKDKQEMGAERETGLTPDTLKEPEVPQDNQTMGPDESKEFAKPSVPAGDGGMGHEDETVGTEVSVETKGTVIAQMEARIKESEVKAERVKLATNLAALELMDGEIAQDEFDGEVSKLATSSVPTLKTLIERYQKRRAKRIAENTKIARKEETVREAKSVGLETPFIIEKQASSDLKDQIMSMMSLEQKLRDFEKENN